MWLFHTHLIQQSGSSVVKQAASIPAEVTPLVIIAGVGHLDVPEVFWNVRLDLPSKVISLLSLLHIIREVSAADNRNPADGLM